jgi:hypothetical protein
METLIRSLILGFCLTVAFADSARGQRRDETGLLLLETAASSTWPMIPLIRPEEDYTPLLLGAGIGALIGGAVLCPIMSGSDTACAGWVVTGGLLGALAGSLLLRANLASLVLLI